MAPVYAYAALSQSDKDVFLNEVESGEANVRTFFCPMGYLSARRILGGTTNDIVVLTGTSLVSAELVEQIIGVAKQTVLTSNGKVITL